MAEMTRRVFLLLLFVCVCASRAREEKDNLSIIIIIILIDIHIDLVGQLNVIVFEFFALRSFSRHSMADDIPTKKEEEEGRDKIVLRRTSPSS